MRVAPRTDQVMKPAPRSRWAKVSRCCTASPAMAAHARPDRLAAARSHRRMGPSGEALQEHLKQVEELLDAERAAIYRGWAAGRTLAEIGTAAGITAEGARQRLKRLARGHPELKLPKEKR